MLIWIEDKASDAKPARGYLPHIPSFSAPFGALQGDKMPAAHPGHSNFQYIQLFHEDTVWIQANKGL